MVLSTDRATRDPDADALVGKIRAGGQPPLSALGVEGARAYLEERAAQGSPGPDVELVRDATIPADERSIAVRVYRSASPEALPIVVYLHGGGWVIGSITASDAFCRRLARAAHCIVISVEYRLAPEHPFPAAVLDAEAAILWAAEQSDLWRGDARRLIVLGDSAGANIGTVAVRWLVAAGRQVVARQILAYPGTRADRAPSAGPWGQEWPLTDNERAWFFEQYVPDDAMRTHPDVAPLLADVSDLPPTTILLGGCDPLADEGFAYAQHLWESGVSVDLHLFSGQIHGFLTLDPAILPRAEEAVGLVANAIRAVGAR
ncbi:MULTISPECIES: alpha/beta hydrolase [unclassified Frankia]|uniref:alpha/beta hydrolase n=1 Tax=unclassified Frankia TaxID=2632575 RepID=UPI0019323370|nr:MULTISPECIES: alpha/beta hydrolase [unclassified Frankia]MBL7489674.1 alpha/beta hydrolase [Frankia sp. AgW1.1]